MSRISVRGGGSPSGPPPPPPPPPPLSEKRRRSPQRCAAAAPPRLRRRRGLIRRPRPDLAVARRHRRECTAGQLLVLLMNAKAGWCVCVCVRARARWRVRSQWAAHLVWLRVVEVDGVAIEGAQRQLVQPAGARAGMGARMKSMRRSAGGGTGKGGRGCGVRANVLRSGGCPGRKGGMMGWR